MFDFGLGASELLVIAVVALVVVGPKDLPKLLRTIGRFVSQIRGMASEFHRHLEAAAREAGVDDIKKEVRTMTNFTATADLGKEMSNEFRKQGEDMKKLLEKKPEPAPPPDQSTGSAEPPAPASAEADSAPPATEPAVKAS